MREKEKALKVLAKKVEKDWGLKVEVTSFEWDDSTCVVKIFSPNGRTIVELRYAWKDVYGEWKWYLVKVEENLYEFLRDFRIVEEL